MSSLPRAERHAALPGAAAPWLVVLSVVTGLTVLTGCGDASVSPAAQVSANEPALVPGNLLHGPLGCPATTGVLVLHRVPVVLVHPETVVVARCDAGAGSPPSGVYVIDGSGAAATVSATLVPPSQEILVTAVKASGPGLQVTGLGYSRADVPRCCPDVPVKLAWRVDGGRLVHIP